MRKRLFASAFLSVAAFEPAIAAVDLVSSTKQLKECVVAASLKLEPSGEAAGDIADAALGDDLCRMRAIQVRYMPGSDDRYLATVSEEARREAVNAIVAKRAGKATRKK